MITNSTKWYSQTYLFFLYFVEFNDLGYFDTDKIILSHSLLSLFDYDRNLWACLIIPNYAHHLKLIDTLICGEGLPPLIYTG